MSIESMENIKRIKLIQRAREYKMQHRKPVKYP